MHLLSFGVPAYGYVAAGPCGFGRDGRRWLYLPPWQSYARQEATHPVRMVTAAVPVDGRLCPVSAKTAQPIAKNRMLAALEEIRALRVQPPVREATSLLENCCRHGCWPWSATEDP